MALRILLAFMFASLCALFAPGISLAQESGGAPEAAAPAEPRKQTLEDILARQRGEAPPRRPSIERLPPPDALPAEQKTYLGTRPPVAVTQELWEGVRFGNVPVNQAVPTVGPAGVMVQTSGMNWLEFRKGPLMQWALYAPGGMLLLLLLFYLIRGRIRIEGPKTGRTVTRFTAIERFGHWLTAVSFILLGLTGMFVFFGRPYLIPLIGKDAYAPLAMGAKWIHDNVAWSFMVGIVLIFAMWVVHNIPSRADLVWLAKGGGLFTRGVHPPAPKFNAGQKIVFWAVVLLGVSISLSGLSLLFPFQLPLFAKTFAALNATGLPELVGLGTLPEQLTPYQEMQLAQVWHAIIAFAYIAIILAHIYIGTIGMEGAFDAMASGEVEEQWAREHHSLWLEELERRRKEAPRGADATPAE